MQKTDYERFSQIISACTDMYNAKKPTEFVMSLWWNALKQYDIGAVQMAFSAHIQNPDVGQFMPKPADIIRLIGGTNSDKALVAWTSVSSAVLRVGTYADVCFDDPVIHCVITDMGGWIKLGTKTDKEWDFVRNEFVTRYRAISAMPVKPEAPHVLTGIANMTNGHNGYPLTAPVMIGNPAKAQQVYMSGMKAERQYAGLVN